MVLTVSLNPALDKTYEIDTINVGEVNRINKVIPIAGGKGINVSFCLKQLGVTNSACGLVGGYTGEFISTAVEEKGIIPLFTKIAGESRTNMNYISAEGVTELLEPGPFVSEDEFEHFIRDYEAYLEKRLPNGDELIEKIDYVCISGSLPKNVPENAYEILCKLANEHNVKVCLDSSGEALRKGLRGRPYMIKPNLKEFEYLLNCKIDSEAEIVDRARQLIRQYGINTVIVTLGDKGLIAINSTDSCRMPAYEVEVINTVGSGDSVVAAFCKAEIEGYSFERKAEFCAKISSATCASRKNSCIDIDTLNRLLR